MPPFPSKYWEIVSRLYVLDLEKHEREFINRVLENMNPYDESELHEGWKEWLLKLDKKYPVKGAK